MKRGLQKLITLPVVLMAQELQAQQFPAPYNSNTNLNYVRVWTASAPIDHEDSVTTRPLKDVKQSTEYCDGLGRRLQIVIKQGSLVSGDSARDYVQPFFYDEFGREGHQYLPFAANNTGGNTSLSDGFFKLNTFQQDSTFNKGMFADETYYFHKNRFETSPLNRVLERFAPGNSWVGTSSEANENNRRSVKMKAWSNTNADSVRIWTVTDVTNSFGTYASSGFYSAGALSKYVTVDEDNKQTIVFYDKGENIILRKTLEVIDSADSGTGKNHIGWACTYYIYDDFDQLRCVIQPKAVQTLVYSSWNLTSTMLDELCFRYEYDHKHRMSMKKLPGSGATYMICDGADRLVLIQDSVLRASHKWAYIKYDALNRPDTSGLITDDTYFNNPAYHRSQAANVTDYPVLSGYSNEILIQNFYDDYTWRASEGNPLSSSRNASCDAYFESPSNAVWPYPVNATQQSNSIKGMSTGQKTKVLGTSTYLYTVWFYDDKARRIQSQSTNISGGTDIVNTQYSFSALPLLNILKSEKSGTKAQTTISVTKFTYDDLSRVIKTEKKISSTNVNNGSMPSSWTILFQTEYDALSQLKKKTLGAEPLETLNYEYNIRGWLLGMNRPYVKDTTNTSNWFGFDLGYDKTPFTVNGSNKSYASAHFNGNIGGLLWKSTGDDKLRKFDFTYDALNRLTSADFNQLTNNTFSRNAGIDFSVNGLTYDLNGNIITMTQRGWKFGGSVTIDSLLYTYSSHSNKLLNVLDQKNDTATSLGDFRSSGLYMTALSNNKTIAVMDYSYDGSGNLTLDNNKDVTLILYNHLKLCDSIRVKGKGTIKYIYDAEGNKLMKITVDSTGTTVKTTKTLYLGGMFVNDTLQFVPTEQGRARIKDSTSIVYDYFIKDHLGNVRMVLTSEKDTSFYPPASMEIAQSSIERDLYANVEESRIEKPDPYSTDNYTDPNDYVSKVGGDVSWIGPSIALRVMAGDKFNVRVSSWWKANDPSEEPREVVEELVSNIVNGVGNISSQHGGATVYQLANSPNILNGVEDFIATQSFNSSRPKAYVSWILFDDQFNYDAGSSGCQQVGDVLDLTIHALNDKLVKKNGYLFICVTNATTEFPVYFDNLQVSHIRGPLLDESHYYPFGLTMAGISSKALAFGGTRNKFKFNSGTELSEKEFNDGSGLELYETSFRSYDAQIGRFHQQDPLGENTNDFSPYSFAVNNPLRYNDPTGLDTIVNGKYCPDAKTLDNVTVTSTKKVKKTKQVDDTQALIGPPNFLPIVTPSTGTESTQIPEEIKKKAPWLTRGVALKALGLGGALLSPLDAGGVMPCGCSGYGVCPHTNPNHTLYTTYNPNSVNYPGHGNRKDNWNPHNVYMFSFQRKPGDIRTPVLKYGIYDAIKNPRRAEIQKIGLELLYGKPVTLSILARVHTRSAALAIERNCVTVHVVMWKEMPREQYRPVPLSGL